MSSEGSSADHFRLLTRLKDWKGGAEEPTTLIMVSFGDLGLKGDEEKQLRKQTDEAYERFRERRGGEIYRMTDTDTAVLAKLTEFNQLESTSELKVDLIRVIQQHFSQYFGEIDQARMLRILELRGRIQNVIKFLETFDDRAQEKGIATDAGGKRPLREGDIQVVRDMMRKMGRKSFVENFIQSQPTALVVPGKPPMGMMSEYFVSVGKILERVLTNVEVKGAHTAFASLTRALDQMLIECFPEINPERAKCSINLNIETVFTHAFQNMLEKGGDKALANVVLEFRQENILQVWDQFETAANLIKSKGGTIAIDAIIPETLGIVDLPRLEAKLAKIFWRPGAENVIPAHRKEILSMQQRGTVMVLARVDDELGVKTGQMCGITMFQGFHIDSVLS